MMGCRAASLVVLAALSLETSSFLLPVPVLPSATFRRTAGGDAPAQSSVSHRTSGCGIVVRSTTNKVIWQVVCLAICCHIHALLLIGTLHIYLAHIAVRYIQYDINKSSCSTTDNNSTNIFVVVSYYFFFYFIFLSYYLYLV